MNAKVKVLTPTCTLGYGFCDQALMRALSLNPDVIAVDAGSTDPGPYYLGSGKPLVSKFSIKKELEKLLVEARKRDIPLIIGSTGGAGTSKHVNEVSDIIKEVAHENKLQFNLCRIYSDIPKSAVLEAVRKNDIHDFEAGFELDEKHVNESSWIVAQMGHEPIVEALSNKADVIVAGRACDDSVIAAYPIWKGADAGLAIHMGKILECGAFSAEPHGADVMLGTIDEHGFVLEPGSTNRRASLISVAAHTLYERENPTCQKGPGHELDLSECTFEQTSDREVRVEKSIFKHDVEYRVKLEGVRKAGYRSISIAGIRCPSMIEQLDNLLEKAKELALSHFDTESLKINYHVYGRNGVMRELENNTNLPNEVGLVIEAVHEEQETANSVAHFLSGHLLHTSFFGQYNTAGNLAFPYSPSEIDVGPFYEFSIYHLMKVDSPNQFFPCEYEEVSS